MGLCSSLLDLVARMVERSFAWTTRFRRLVRDYERLPGTLAGLHLVVFACLMLHQWMAFSSPGK